MNAWQVLALGTAMGFVAIIFGAIGVPELKRYLLRRKHEKIIQEEVEKELSEQWQVLSMQRVEHKPVFPSQPKLVLLPQSRGILDEVAAPRRMEA